VSIIERYAHALNLLTACKAKLEDIEDPVTKAKATWVVQDIERQLDEIEKHLTVEEALQAMPLVN